MDYSFGVTAGLLVMVLGSNLGLWVKITRVERDMCWVKRELDKANGSK